MESVQAWLPADWLQPLSGLVAVVSGSALCQKLLPEALSVAFAAARERAGQASQPADFTALGPAPAGQAGPVLRYVGLPAQHVFPKRRKSHAAEYDTYGVDGVWKTAWLSKHRNDVPGLLVVAAEFDARMPAQVSAGSRPRSCRSSSCAVLQRPASVRPASVPTPFYSLSLSSPPPSFPL